MHVDVEHRHGRLDIAFRAPRLSVMLPVPISAFAFPTYEKPTDIEFEDPTETRREHGERLRRAAREAAAHVEKGILAELRRQGHLV